MMRVRRCSLAEWRFLLASSASSVHCRGIVAMGFCWDQVTQVYRNSKGRANVMIDRLSSGLRFVAVKAGCVVKIVRLGRTGSERSLITMRQG